MGVTQSQGDDTCALSMSTPSVYHCTTCFLFGGADFKSEEQETFLPVLLKVVWVKRLIPHRRFFKACRIAVAAAYTAYQRRILALFPLILWARFAERSSFSSRSWRGGSSSPSFTAVPLRTVALMRPPSSYFISTPAGQALNSVPTRISRQKQLFVHELQCYTPQACNGWLEPGQL